MLALALFLVHALSKCTEPVVIVGGGMAGLAAASEALASGAENVIIIDKEGKVGGNSAKATSGINGPASHIQKEQGVADSIEQFAYDTMLSGAMGDETAVEFGRPNALVKTLSVGAAPAIKFLTDKGADLTNLVQLGGHRGMRTHRPQGGRPAGWTFVSAVKKSLEGLVNYRTSTTVTGLMVKQGKVVGVKWKDDTGAGEILSNSVVLATGGYANDHTYTSLLARHRPDLVDTPTTNGPWATGDGVKLGLAIGAQVVDMEAVQIHPTGFVDPTDRDASTKFLAPEALRGSGAIMLNAQGQRFVNELDLRAVVVAAMQKQTGPIKLLLNAEAKEKFGPGLNFYQKKGFAVPYDSLTAAAESMGVDVSILEGTISNYESGRNAGKDEYGKEYFPVAFKTDEDMYLLAEVMPVIHYTMGGLKITEKGEILGKGDVPVVGLYGAGEVTGGVHGKNRLAGNSLLECVVYGRIAGTQAANHACSATPDSTHAEL